MAVLLREPQAVELTSILRRERELSPSAATVIEALIVADRNRILDEMKDLVSRFGMNIITLTYERALAAAEAARRWGKGVHQARLNYGDCFAYALAKELDCPLLYVGDDFARTDVRNALG